MPLCLPRFSQTAKLRALFSKLTSLLRTFYPSCKELGAHYKEESTQDHSHFWHQLQVWRWCAGRESGVEGSPYILRFRNLLEKQLAEISYSHKVYYRESVQVINSRRKRCIEHIYEGSRCKGCSCSQDELLSWHQYADCQSEELTQAFVSRIFTVPSISRRDWLIAHMIVQMDWYHMTQSPYPKSRGLSLLV